MSGILQGLIGSLKSAASAASDAYFNLVTLLLNTTSTNGAQNNTFLDSSTNNFSITRNGNTTQGTFTPFSQTGWSNYFVRANTDYLGLPNGSVATGSNDFSIEAFIYPLDKASNYAVFGGNTDRATAGGSSITLTLTSSNAYMEFTGWFGGSAVNLYSTTIPSNTWTHFVVCRTGGTLGMFLNGTRVSTTSCSGSINAGSATFNPSIGSNGTGSADNYTGYISNFRMIIGSGVYDATTTTYIVPTAPLTATANTKVLSCQSNRFVDNSANNYTITPSGSPSVQAFSPFAPTAAYGAAVVGGSGYFDGTGDLLQAPSSANLTLSTGDFTLELFVYPTSWNSSLNQSLLSGNGTIYGFSFGANQYYSGKLTFGYEGVFTIIEDAILPTVNMWSHVACTRSGNVFKVFINGVQSGSTITYSADFTASLRNIGSNTTSAGFFNGYISSVRVLKGTALYTANFTPPTAPLTAITNTQLLTNFTNAGIFDSAAKNVAETVGTAQVSTTQAKFGTTSMKFDGSTSSWLLVPFRPTLDLSTGAPDWTLECWGYVADFTNSPFFFNKGGVAAATYTNYAFSMTGNTSTGTVYCTLGNNGGETAYTFGTCSVNTWYHFAATRQGSTIRTFLNGVLVTSQAIAATMTDNGGDLYIGCLKNLTTNVLNGYVDDLRITKGYARYTATFTPPTAAFPLQ